MSDNRNFKVPDGAEPVGRPGKQVRIQVSIPSDGDGFFGRQCPDCSLIFRMDMQQYKALPDDLTLWCVYCGHRAEHSNFLTQQQRNRVIQAAGNYGMQQVSRRLGKAIRSRPSGSRRSGVSISVTTKPYRPRPLPGINEERLVRVRTCPDCQIDYAVFGEHRYCPVCGQLPAASVALDALQADTARLAALDALPNETKALLREQGVFTRNWVDTVENVVGVVEALASALFHAAVPDAEKRVKGKGAIFQRLDPMTDLFVDAGFCDLRPALGHERWQRLLTTWAARHVFTHNDGIVDDKYLVKVPNSPARTGQRLVPTEDMCRQAIEDTKALCETLVDGLR
ncbi:hypothetical protein ABZ038_02275 [Streptomyces sp. NPDC006349]|uniref:hypothetical protein n=1 Tax=Streptomyces sp. NPDC006349 TaxID=3156757 RepID=UPI0006B91C08|nr:hypothetical protein ADL35_32785 [Streptomyces sp. NRRL WC-3753]